MGLPSFFAFLAFFFSASLRSASSTVLAPSATTTMENCLPRRARSIRCSAIDLGVVGDFRDEDHVAAAGDARVEREPAGLVSHDLDHHDAVVRMGRRVQPVDGLGRDVDRGVETEADVRLVEVVVDGLGQADAVEAELGELVAPWSACRCRRGRRGSRGGACLQVSDYHARLFVGERVAVVLAEGLFARAAEDGAARR